MCWFEGQYSLIEVKKSEGLYKRDLDLRHVYKAEGEDERPSSISCVCCGLDSCIGDDFNKRYWFSLESEPIHTHMDCPDDIVDWIEDNLGIQVEEIFRESFIFCGHCVYEFERGLESVLDEDFQTWIVSQSI